MISFAFLSNDKPSKGCLLTSSQRASTCMIHDNTPHNVSQPSLAFASTCLLLQCSVSKSGIRIDRIRAIASISPLTAGVLVSPAQNSEEANPLALTDLMRLSYSLVEPHLIALPSLFDTLAAAFWPRRDDRFLFPAGYDPIMRKYQD